MSGCQRGDGAPLTFHHFCSQAKVEAIPSVVLKWRRGGGRKENTCLRGATKRGLRTNHTRGVGVGGGGEKGEGEGSCHPLTTRQHASRDLDNEENTQRTSHGPARRKYGCDAGGRVDVTRHRRCQHAATHETRVGRLVATVAQAADKTQHPHTYTHGIRRATSLRIMQTGENNSHSGNTGALDTTGTTQTQAHNRRQTVRAAPNTHPPSPTTNQCHFGCTVGRPVSPQHDLDVLSMKGDGGGARGELHQHRPPVINNPTVQHQTPTALLLGTYNMPLNKYPTLLAHKSCAL